MINVSSLEIMEGNGNMERLTERMADGILVKEDYGEDILKTLYQCYGAKPMPHYANCDGGYCAMEKLAEYEYLEEQGKLLKLPCAVGDTVYSFSFGKILTLCVDSFVIYADGIDARLSSKMKEYEFLKIDIDIADFGKKWFATQEEAEAALKEL